MQFLPKIAEIFGGYEDGCPPRQTGEKRKRRGAMRASGLMNSHKIASKMR